MRIILGVLPDFAQAFAETKLLPEGVGALFISAAFMHFHFEKRLVLK
jgi:hypothetical protein